MRKRFYRWLAKKITKHNGMVLLICIILTVAMIIAASRLSMKTSIVDMMPEGYPQVKEFNDIVRDYASASSAMIVVESKEKDKELMKKCAEDIAQRFSSLILLKMKSNQKLPFKKQMAAFMHQHPIPGVAYDTVQLVKRIDYQVDTEYYTKYGLITQKSKDLKNYIAMFSSVALADLIENINNNFEQEYVNDADNLSSIDGEQQAIQGLAAMDEFVQSVGNYVENGDSDAIVKSVNRFVTGPEYFFSSDNTLLLLMLQPAINLNDNYEEFIELGKMITDTLRSMESEYPSLVLGATGSPILLNDEMESTKKDFGWSSVIALILILILLIGSFGSLRNPFYSITTLVIALIWVSGFLGLVLQYLNMLSISFGIVLIGLGIDFAIHFITGFKDGQESGLSVSDSIVYMYDKVGNGVVTGAVTTSLVFFTLSMVGFKALTEMGIAVGAGIVICLLAMMVLLPTLIVWDNKGYSLIARGFEQIKCGFIPLFYSKMVKGVFSLFELSFFQAIHRFFSFLFLEKLGHQVNRLPIALGIIIVALITVIFSVMGARNIQFEYNMMKLEAEGIPAAVNQDKILDKFEISPDFAVVTASDIADCREKVKALKRLADRMDNIGMIEGISEYLPTEEQQRNNKKHIQEFAQNLMISPIPEKVTKEDRQKLLRELTRLHQNIVEIGELSITSSGEDNKVLKKCDEIVGQKDEDSRILKLVTKLTNTQELESKLSAYQKVMSGELKKQLLQRTSTEQVTFENLPQDIKKRFINQANNNLLISIYPKNEIWEEKNLRSFAQQTSKVTGKITGLPIITLLFIDLVGEKGSLATLLGAIAIVALLLLDFRSFKYAGLAMIPLAVGACWMLGAMALLHMKFNYYNFMALPLILGIGIDDGVHILHRYHLEGKGSVPLLLRYTGRAILLTSLTTMIGFGSMAFATMRGTASMGLVLVFGVGACFLSSVFVLPSLITIMERMGILNKSLDMSSENQSNLAVKER